MSSNTSRHVVCRLLGGSGRPQLMGVPTRKRPVLCTPLRHIPADTIALPRSLATPLSLRLLSSLSSKVAETQGEPSALREPFPVLHCEPISFFSTLPLWGLSSDAEKR